MSVTALTALVASLAGLVTAIGGVIAIFRHVNGPNHSNGTTAAPVTFAGGMQPAAPVTPQPAVPQDGK